MFLGAQSQEGEVILAVQFPDCVSCLVHQVMDVTRDVYSVAVVHSGLQGDACNKHITLNTHDALHLDDLEKAATHTP